MPDPTFGQLFHTQDGKTVFIDPKGKATVFEGVLTMDKIMEPKDQIMMSNASVKPEEVPEILKAMLSQLPMLPMMPIVPMKFDFVLMTGPQPNQVVSSQTDEDILGPKDYYILVPDESEASLKLGATTRIYAWVSEHKKGHKPDYKGHSKHRILPEQWEWLLQHKDCPVVAWYSQECPAFASVACQTHAKAMQPRLTAEKVESSSEGGAFASSESIEVHSEIVSAEERVV
jgi:hypothetical protein